MRSPLSRWAALVSLVTVLVAASGCEQSPTTVPGSELAPSAALVDAANGGSAGLYFLPPTVPAVPAYSGVFDGSVLAQLSVETCELDATGSCPLPPVVTYTSTATDYRNAIRLNEPRAFYVVYWNVAPADAGAGRVYRASVLASGSPLGHVDFVDPVAGRWLPVTFRVEEGAFDESPPPVSAITSNVDGSRVGSGLQSGTWSFELETPAPTGGVEVRVRSDEPSLLRVARDAASPGSDEITVVVPGGGTSGAFWVQGMEGATGVAEVEFTATVRTGAATVLVVPVAADLFLLGSSVAASAPDVPFHVRVGAIDAPGAGLYAAQAVRAGGAPLTFTVANGEAAVGRLVTTAGAAQVRTVTVPVGASLTPADVASGGVAFDPVGVGTTTVTLSHPTVTLLAGAIQDVSVTDAIVVQTSGVRVGSGLQYLAVFTLGAAAPAGGITVHLESSDPGRLLLAPDVRTAATAGIDVTVGAGLGGKGFYLAGVEGATGTATITASAPGYTDAESPVIVTAVGVRIILLATTQDGAGANDPFVAQIGAIGPSGTSLFAEQDVRVGGPPIVVDLANSDAGVAQFVTAGGAAQAATVTIGVGQGRSPAGPAVGGVELDPLAPGQTTVSANGAGLVPLAGATVVVTVH